MPDRPEYKVRVLAPAALDAVETFEWGVTEFGAEAAVRYADLIDQAIRDVGDDPKRPGSRAVEGREGVRVYSLHFSRKRVGGRRVLNPRHVVVYRIRGTVVEVLRILHDSRELERHIEQ